MVEDIPCPGDNLEYILTFLDEYFWPYWIKVDEYNPEAVENFEKFHREITQYGSFPGDFEENLREHVLNCKKCLENYFIIIAHGALEKAKTDKREFKEILLDYEKYNLSLLVKTNH